MIKAAYHSYQLHRKHSFDYLHYTTLSDFRSILLLGFVGPKLILGPLTGGDTIPRTIYPSLTFRNKASERTRSLINLICKFSPLHYLAYAKADYIYAATDETKQYIPSIFHNKVLTIPAISLREEQLNQTLSLSPIIIGEEIKILWSARYQYWKGLELALYSFCLFHKANKNSSLTLLAWFPKRNDALRINDLINQLGIASVTTIVEWLPRERLSAFYTQFNLFLFPSYRDSGGFVVLEAMAHGLPCVCLDHAGPGLQVNNSCGRAISLKGLSSINEIVQSIAHAMLEITTDNSVYKQLSEGAKKRARAFSTHNIVTQIYRPILEKLN